MPMRFFNTRRRKYSTGRLFAFWPSEYKMVKTHVSNKVFGFRSGRTVAPWKDTVYFKFLQRFKFAVGTYLVLAILGVAIVLVAIALGNKCLNQTCTRPQNLPLAPVSVTRPDSILTGQKITLSRGRTLAGTLGNVVLDRNGIVNALRVLSEFIDLHSLPAGQDFYVGWTPKGQGASLRSIVLERGLVDRIFVFKDKDGQFRGQYTKNFLQDEIAETCGVIENSLYTDGVAAGIPANKLTEVFDAFAFTIDFQRDLHKGDEFQFCYTVKKNGFGEVASVGDLKAARLTNMGREYQIFRYKDANGRVGFYDKTGKGIQKALLLMPVNGGRLTSTYGIRVNPLYGYTENHPALDFGAPLGTPIMAAGDGVIMYRGWDPKGYGNYLKVRHNNGYVTLYAHMSRIDNRSVVGAAVTQGQTIGYVGATGMATGPHVHYEIWVNGVRKNPATVVRNMGSDRRLTKKELVEFKEQIKPYLEKFNLTSGS